MKPISDCQFVWRRLFLGGVFVVVGVFASARLANSAMQQDAARDSGSSAQQPDAVLTAPFVVSPSGNIDLAAQNQPLVYRAEAYSGQPYGIGRVTFRLQPGDELVKRTGAVWLTDRENRTLYPVITSSAVKAFIQNLTGNRNSEPDDSQTVWFLFRGDGPLDLTLEGTGGTSFVVPVETAKRQRQFDRYVRQWWQAFTRVINEQVEASDYPPIVETYLMSLIGRRMGLEVSDPFERKRDPLMQTFELMFDVESLRMDTIRESMLYGLPSTLADRPLPKPIQWTPVLVENLPAAIDIEPIAKAVPEECFYLRFGTWSNQIWLQTLMEEFGGNLSRMIQVRGFQYRIQSKFLNQLGIQSTEWDRLFGGNLIGDVAVIGTDTHFDDGAAVGVLLQAKATERLKANLVAKRKKFAQDNADIGATIEVLRFGDDKIQFLSTPDNRYRSFYAVSGDSHLMTTSLTIAKRFLESCRGVGSLADSAEYKFARFNMPLDREDTIFIYASTKFFQQLLAPQYQIELRRRNRIMTDMMLLELASLAAQNEGQANLDVDGLIASGFLPNGFGARPDQGSFEIIDDRWHDSIRGRRGFFAPIPDVPIASVSSEEAAWFNERATFFSSAIRSLDPMFVAIKRYQRSESIERVVFDARLAPFGEEKYGWLMGMLGPPLSREIATTPNDIIRLQASMRGGTTNPNVPPHQVFAAVQDRLDPNVDLRPSSFIRVLQTLKEAPGYLGAWPSPGYTDWMPALGREPDALGYSYSRILNLWKLQWNGFSVLSFDQNRLESLKPHLQVVESERAAQVRLLVGDLAHSNLRGWANSLNYRRSWQTSIANVKLLNLLTQQFRVRPDFTLATAQRMLDVELVCSLDGKYELVPLASGRSIWRSTAWPSFATPELPPDHVAPLLKWFRGLEVEVVKGDTQFGVHGWLDLERQAIASDSALPSFDLFNGFGNLFGGTGSDASEEQSTDEPPVDDAKLNADQETRSVGESTSILEPTPAQSQPGRGGGESS